jgi:hypothetical protein
VDSGVDSSKPRGAGNLFVASNASCLRAQQKMLQTIGRCVRVCVYSKSRLG